MPRSRRRPAAARPPSARPKSAGTRASADAGDLALPPPPAWKDPWLLAGVLAVSVVLFRSLGAALGEPVAEDFDFLRHVVLGRNSSWLDGGGSLSFWRPLSQQTYYGLLGPLMLDHPRVVAAFHFGLLLATALFLHRLLRTWWPGWAAAAAAAFPLVAEGSRSLLTWPGHFADLGCLFFSVAALLAAVRRRFAIALTALAAALLCKEPAIVTALLLPWLPAPPNAAGARDAGAERRRLLIGTAAVVIVWGVAYVLIRRSAGLMLPHGLEADFATRSEPLARRLLWAFNESGRSVFSRPVARTAGEIETSAALLSLALAATAVALFVRRGRSLRTDRALALWGFAWFALSSAALATIYPLWSPVRGVFGAVGLGVLLVAAWRRVHPAIPALLLAAKLGALAVAPGPPATITSVFAENGDFMDFARITRLQRLMAETRTALRRDVPRLAPHSVIGESNMPHEAVYAFGGSRAVQAWYRDTTLRWVRVDQAVADTSGDVRGIVQFQPQADPQLAVVDPRALRALIAGGADVDRRAWSEGLAKLAAADSLQRDPAARAFRADVASRRAYALDGLDRPAEAVAEARRAVNLSPGNRSARATLVWVLAEGGDRTSARAELDSLRSRFPGDASIDDLRRRLKLDAAPGDSTAKLRP